MKENKDLLGMMLDKNEPKEKPVVSVRDITVPLVYPGTPGVEKLFISESPKSILSQDFPEHKWEISGSWGYIKEMPLVIEVKNKNMVKWYEREFLKHRTFEEAYVFRPEGERLCAFTFKDEKHYKINGNNGNYYERLTMKVYCFKEDDAETLRRDLEDFDDCADDPEKLMMYMAMMEEKRIEYEVEAWYDVTKSHE